MAKLAPGLSSDLDWIRRNRLRADGDYALTIAEHAAAMAVIPEQTVAIQAGTLEGSTRALSNSVEAHIRSELNRIGVESVREVSAVRPSNGWLEVLRTCGCEQPSVVFHVVDAPNSGITRFTENLLVHYPHAELQIHHTTIWSPAWGDMFPSDVACNDRESSSALAPNVVVLGNNWDHTEMIRTLNAHRTILAQGANAGPWIAYLHDLTLWYLLEGVFGSAFRSHLREDYGSGIDRVDASSALAWGMTGVRTLARTIPMDGVITNSSMGAGMLADELAGCIRLGVESVFHPPLMTPIHDDLADQSPHEPTCHGIGDLLRAEEPYIGSFGVPFDWKLPEVVEQAFDRLQAEGLGRTLVFAGYRADRVLDSSIRARADVVVLSDLCESCMQQAMLACRMALQPRAILGGEASGVTSLLMGLRIPTVASRGLGDEPTGPIRLVSVSPDASEMAAAALRLHAEVDGQHQASFNSPQIGSRQESVAEYIGAFNEALEKVMSRG